MAYLADLHVHSHFSRATSDSCRPDHLAEAAARKGLAVVGTGDFTHAGWRAELGAQLVEAEEGFYRLRTAEGPAAQVRFVVTGEISCIYKQGGRTRKIHHLVLLPSLEAAARVSAALEARGANLEADGRPIVGLDSRNLLALVLEVEPAANFIPAHIWTPHFSLFGANSGFDAIEECFGDLAREIAAYETGLSSDPPMNWRLSALDRLTLVSNSDAHSPDKLGREANEFEAAFSYPGMTRALRREEGSVMGTVEFFPEEGKYHYDGHRNCGVCWHPQETLAARGICPVCGRPVTVGVLHRVIDLADRPEGFRPPEARTYTSLVPLDQIVADALGVGPASQRVEAASRKLLEALGPEIPLAREGDLGAVSEVAGAAVAEAVRRVRMGEIAYRPGYDGEYGKLAIFHPEERRKLAGQGALFVLPAQDRGPGRRGRAATSVTPREEAASAAAGAPAGRSPATPLDGLNAAQRQAVTASAGPVIVIAGPGTGKTRTLIRRIAYLLREGVRQENITAITFTHRAADEMRRRLASEVGADVQGVWVGTFHRFCTDLLTRANGTPPLVLDAREAAALAAEAAGPGRGGGARLAEAVSLLKSRGLRPGDPGVPAAFAEQYRRYQQRLASEGAHDYDDLLLCALDLLREDGTALRGARERAAHLLVDEFQDVNVVQYQLIKALAGDGRNLFVIGDPDQAIYGFRGADPRFVAQLAEDFPSAISLRLTLNYRSAGTIVQAASALLAIPSAAAAAQPGGQPLRHVAADDPQAEARAVVREIERLVGGSGMLAADRQSGKRIARAFSLGEIAVLFRTGRQAQPIEEALLVEGIPYRILGQRPLLAAPEVRESLDILRYLDRPTDLRFLVALRDTRFNPGAEALAILRGSATGQGAGSWDQRAPLATRAAALLRAGSFAADAREKIQGLLDLVAELGDLTATASAAELLVRAAGSEGSTSRALQQVARAAGERPLAEFLFRLATGQEADYERHEERARPGEAISLLTMHAAKGLEFPAAIVVGLADGIVPWKDAADGEALAEERRLFYVALTRASEALVLIGPPAAGGTAPQSRFLQELPAELVEFVGSRAKKPRLQQRGLF